MLKLKNTLTRAQEEFNPLEGNTVRIYACGPTVYDHGHIGNFRTFVAVDVLRRYLKYLGYQVNHVVNITDVDDKIIRGVLQSGKSLREYTEFYTQAFLEDARALNIEQPEVMPRATDHIPEMIELMKRLADAGLTYKSDGSLYYSIASFPSYGRLSGLKVEGNISGARVDVDEYEKADARDFVLWKEPKEEGEPRWASPFGEGRPGWHLECSAMSMKYLGESFDIHCGGVDLIFPHHENEIAQSEGATGKPFVRFWVHAEFLLVEGEKMSKSLGNFFTLRDLFAKGYKPSALRFALASVPYRKQLNFTFDGLQQAASSVERLRNFRDRLKQGKFPAGKQDGMAERIAKAAEEFDAGLSDDLNTARALAAVFDLVREANIAIDKGEFRQGDVQAVLDFLAAFDKVFAVVEDNDAEKLRALGYGGGEGGPGDEEIDKLVAERK